MIERFLRLPNDTANISYNMGADFLEWEKIRFAPLNRKREQKTRSVFAELMLREQSAGNQMNVSGFDL